MPKKDMKALTGHKEQLQRNQNFKRIRDTSCRLAITLGVTDTTTKYFPLKITEDYRTDLRINQFH